MTLFITHRAKSNFINSEIVFITWYIKERPDPSKMTDNN